MSELWRQCAGWLLRLEVLPENHRVVWPDATIEDVAYTLRQAVYRVAHLVGQLCWVDFDLGRSTHRHSSKADWARRLPAYCLNSD